MKTILRLAFALIALLAVYPAGGLHAASTIIASTPLGPVKSSDGVTWSVIPVNVNSGLLSGQPGFYALAVDPKTPSTWYAFGAAENSTFGFYRTTDSGQTWTGTAFIAFQPSLGAHAGSIVIDPVTTSTIYGLATNFIIKSTDSGATWTKLKLPNTIGYPAVSFPDGAVPNNLSTDPKITGLVYAIAGHYLFKSIDFGVTWTVLSTGVDTPERNNAESGAFPSLGHLDVDPRVSTTLYASANSSRLGPNCKGTPSGGECGLYKSVDNGATWTQLGLQSPSADSFSLDPVSGAIYAGGVLTGGNGAIFKSTDGGTTFTPLKNPFPLFGPFVSIDPNNPTTVYAFAQLGSSIGDSSYYRSTDGGATWSTLKSPGLCAITAKTCDPNTIPSVFSDIIILPQAAGVAGPPAISANGIVNGASFQAGVVANSWVTIQGTNLAAQTDDWSHSIVNGALPTTLDGVSVTMGGKPAYVYFVSPNQLNVLAPDVPAGPISVTVTTAGGTSSAFATTASAYGPAFFLWPNNQVVATRQDYSYAVKAGTFAGATTVPAKPGDVIILWATGFGPTMPAAPLGASTPASGGYPTASAPTVTIDNLPATVYGAALAPGSAGLYQIAIQVPSSLANGDWSIQASIGGIASPAGTILSVHQ